uniref:C2H2-type domain-containing protein n=1 Tax=Bursaphelenchus xylophilus TaxID=6326 RepID=A0A1I7S789_BURXY
MNVHNDVRPFSCDECDFAAASQMTLRRHKLRNHVPRSEWGYQCPHCVESFMEPASYQQHVANRHPGLSAKFGCPICDFSSYCSRHFQEHYGKHATVIARHPWIAPESSHFILVEFLIDDNGGKGYLSMESSRDAMHKESARVFQMDDLYETSFFTSQSVDTKEVITQNLISTNMEEAAMIDWVQNEITIDAALQKDCKTINGFLDEDLD